MIRWTSEAGKVAGFTYLPLWETLVGLLLLVVSIGVPILFARMNGLHLQQWPEWIFLIGFALFFGFMGRKLVVQSFQARLLNGRLRIAQTLREPAVFLEVSPAEVTGFAREEIVDHGRPFFQLLLLQAGRRHEVYRSIQAGEIDELKKALEVLHRSP